MVGSSWRELLPALGERTLIMGVVNVTPDSFSDGGRYSGPECAVAHALALVEAGADLVDVGGESSRPGADLVPLDVELERVVPVIHGLRRRADVVVSVDTTKAEVARQGVEAGAQVVNDISAFGVDPDMLGTVAATQACGILMHMRGRPKTMQAGQLVYPEGVVDAVTTALRVWARRAIDAGIPAERIAVDPGIGFGKTVAHNLEILRYLKAFRGLGFPLVVGTSRKSFLGEVTGRPVCQREWATAASVALAIARGADIVRVHDVAAMVDVVRVADAIVRC